MAHVHGCARAHPPPLTMHAAVARRGRPTWRALTTRLRLATREDIAGILDLQEPNLRENGGHAVGALHRRVVRGSRSATCRSSWPARSGRIVGYLVSSSKAAQAPCADRRRRCCGPILEQRDAYVYGPICVAESERGQNLPAALMSALRERLPGREGITFIRARQRALDAGACQDRHARGGGVHARRRGDRRDLLRRMRR